ncbi:class I SAM-dependent methyltransferase [Mycolicibacterium helvum]|uniref:class I SAM-dependent methyltransferase n=1 Tax=Mycolicibacterium helvum TaxID=1534349 RepID=UPI0013D7192A|nr:class I SAM-dependent methyltransferase [Mycolicibacterium helvum]
MSDPEHDGGGAEVPGGSRSSMNALERLLSISPGLRRALVSETGPGRLLRRAWYVGPQQCNLCGSWVRFRESWIGAQLIEYGFPYPIDDFETLNHSRYLCPVCRSNDRDRLYKLYIDRFLPPNGVRRVLEFAPSTTLSAYLRGRDDLRYRTADLMMAGVDDVVDITDMPIYPDGSFDFFMCSHILEHVSDDSLALKELYRILAPGGSGIIMTPVMPEGRFDEDPTVTDEAERWRRFAQGDHVRLYDRSTLCSRIKQSGLELSLLDRNTFGDKTFKRHAIALGSVLYVVRRPTTDAA